MLINSVIVENYKGFNLSEEISLTPGTNILIGKNNAGKSALIEAIGRFREGARPHLTINRPRGRPVAPVSRVGFRITFASTEIYDALLRYGKRVAVRLPPGQTDSKKAAKYIQALLESADQFTATLEYNASGNWTSKCNNILYPSDTVASGPAIIIDPEGDKLKYLSVAQQGDDGLFPVLTQLVTESIYEFKAQRLNIGAHAREVTKVLRGDGANLPALLAILQENPVRFRRYEHAVRRVFPEIQHVSLKSNPSNAGIVEIQIWTHSPESERDDLAHNLTDCGTGLGQVLAILYVAIENSSRNMVIAIDEPNSFLHPGAAKALIEILKEQSNHQLVISTHSSDIVRRSECSNLIRLYVEDGETRVESIDGTNVQRLSSLMMELGIQTSDIFGADSIIWVEGQTEALVLPILLEGTHRDLLSRTSIVPIRNVGDIEAIRPEAQAIADIYQTLSHANALIPPTIAFFLDSEDRTERHKQDIARQTNGKVAFLPRRTIENYVLCPKALSTLMSSLAGFPKEEVTSEKIGLWLDNSRRKREFEARGESVEDWGRTVNAPKLLSAIFLEMSDKRQEYRKTLHTPQLFRLILKSDPTQLSHLIEFFTKTLTAIERPEARSS